MFALVFLAAIGCKNDNQLVSETDPVDLPSPRACIAVDPAELAFGDLNPAEDLPRTEFVTVRSTCEADLEIYGLGLADSGVPFEVGAIGSIVLSPGASTDFTVTFSPLTAGEATSRVLIASNDPDLPQATVDLSGNGIAPVIEVTPELHDFGGPYIGCDVGNPWTVRNIGTADLRVTAYDFTVPTDDFSLGSLSEPPFTLPPGAQTTLDIDVHALHDVPQRAYLTVSSNDPQSPEVTVEATVEPIPYRHAQDAWDQPIRTGADVLFVVDNSCSMYEEQSSLADNFQVFVDTLTEADSDWRLAVITTDDPQFRGPIIDRDTPNAVSEFQTQAMAGTNGDAWEMGLELAAQSTRIGEDAGPTGLFWRDESTLSIVILSDEEDGSPLDVATYISGWTLMKGSASLVRVHAIAGEVPQPACNTAQAAHRYDEAVTLTGGQFVSICTTDWGVNLESVALGTVIERRLFSLSQTAVPETIDVHVDGVRIVDGWEYEPLGNSVVFDPEDVPTGGALVLVDYEVMPDCDG